MKKMRHTVSIGGKWYVSFDGLLKSRAECLHQS